jgi:hypothetical protein
LSDRYAIRQRKSETEQAFYKRVGEEIDKKPDYYFMRWDVTISKQKVDQFEQRTLQPLLTQLCNWWDKLHAYFVKKPDMRWQYPHVHWQSPWGVHNSLAGGFRGEYFGYLTTGSKIGLEFLAKDYK